MAISGQEGKRRECGQRGAEEWLRWSAAGETVRWGAGDGGRRGFIEAIGDRKAESGEMGRAVGSQRWRVGGRRLSVDGGGWRGDRFPVGRKEGHRE